MADPVVDAIVNALKDTARELVQTELTSRGIQISETRLNELINSALTSLVAQAAEGVKKTEAYKPERFTTPELVDILGMAVTGASFPLEKQLREPVLRLFRNALMHPNPSVREAVRIAMAQKTEELEQ